MVPKTYIVAHGDTFSYFMRYEDAKHQAKWAINTRETKEARIYKRDPDDETKKMLMLIYEWRDGGAVMVRK